MFYSPKRKYVPENVPQEEENKINDLKENEKNEENNNNIDISEIKLNEEQEYELEFDEDKYILKTGYSKENDSILLKIIPLENKDKENIIIYYESLFSFNDLTKLCKSFRMYDSIEEIFSAFCVIFENRKAYIKQNSENEKEEENILNLVIVVGSVTGKEDEILLTLNKKEIKRIIEDKKEEILPGNEPINNVNSNFQCNCALKEKEIYSRMEKIEKELRDENFDLKNEIFYLKDDVNRYKKIVDTNKKEIKNLKTQIKEMKSSFEEKIKNLTEKINSINLNIKDNINSNRANNNISYENKINIDKEVSDNNNNNNEELNRSYASSKKNLKQSPIKNINQKKNNINNNDKPAINTQGKNKNLQEKKTNNKREIYQQMKAANAQKLNNMNKDKKTSFGEFIKQQKSLGNKIRHSIEVKEPSHENNKVLQKFNTNFIPQSSKINVNQSVNVAKNRYEIEDEENDNNIKKIEENENENNENYEEENVNDNLNINDNINENESRNKNNDKDKDKDKKAEDDLLRMKTYDTNRNDKIDQWKCDFDLNVKKLLEDNESKLKLAEKIDKMNRKIINNVEELQLIENRLLKNYPNSNDINYTLVYRASEDGDSAEIFHNKCDDIPFTLTVIKSTDGYKFGGFTEETWEGEDTTKKDYNAFCFSLTKNKIYDVINNENAIVCDPAMGPTFGSPLFHIYDNFLSKGGLCCAKDNCGYSGQDSDFEITNGDEEFGVQEIEVYRISFD